MSKLDWLVLENNNVPFPHMEHNTSISFIYLFVYLGCGFAF